MAMSNAQININRRKKSRALPEAPLFAEAQLSGRE